MAQKIILPTFSKESGNLTVVEKILPFEIKRVYYIYKSDGKIRGGHKHKKTQQALMCVSGSCDLHVRHNGNTQVYSLTKPNECILLDPEDWHEMRNMKNGAVILVLASEHYDPDDYIDCEDP